MSYFENVAVENKYTFDFVVLLSYREDVLDIIGQL